MDLSNLKPAPGATHRRKRVGRGQGSTLGKTCGAGQKGQKSRSGGNVRPDFEGGQMPLNRRVPKVGFTNINRKAIAEVNLHSLERCFEAGAVVDEQALRDAGLLKGRYDGYKILGQGNLTKALTVSAHRFSKSAAARIEELGGTAEVISG